MNFEPLTIINSDVESSIRWSLELDCSSSFHSGDKNSYTLLNPGGQIKLGIQNTSETNIPRKKYQFRTSSPALESSQTLLPSYAPPPAASINFCMHLKGDMNVPEKPKLPTCKTNTNMATYVHKRFMYQVYVTQLYGSRHESTSVSKSSLKHSYQPSLSRSQSFILSVSSGRLPLVYSYSQIFDDPLNTNMEVF